MNRLADARRLGEFDRPWRRFPWVAIAGLALWIALLAAFSMVLELSKPPPAAMKPLEARIVEIPPEVGGLSAGGGTPAPPPAHRAPAKPRAPGPAAPAVSSIPKHAEIPAAPVSPEGTAPAGSSPAPTAGTASTTTGSSGGAGAAAGGGATTGGGPEGSGGLGSDDLGAHAIYAPAPEIPEDLRENVIHAVAIAHFKVSSDGQVSVSLVSKTDSPRLNRILLDTLEQWRFFPATKNGVPIDSEFDLTIPITVQ
jgi:protein TonB